MTSRKDPDVQPEDFPIEILGQTESVLIAQADHQRNRARGWTSGYPTGGTHGSGPDPEYPDEAARVGFYESALAYYESARQLGQAGVTIARHLAERAQQEQKPVHVWPLPFTANQAGYHPDPHGVLPDAQVRFPRWGIDCDTGSPDTETYVSLCPATGDDGDMILRVSTGTAGNAGKPPQQEQSVRISQGQWASLVALAARIAAGEPIPYDERGNTFTQQRADR